MAEPILGSTSHRLQWKATLGAFIMGLLVFGIGVGALAGYGYMVYGAVDSLLTDAEVWESGTVALDGGIEGEVTTRQFIFDSYELDVDWLDAQGSFHETELEFSTLFGSVDDNEPVEVRYLARGGEFAVATSWGQSVRGSRWTAAIFILVMGLLIGALFVWLGKNLMGVAVDRIRTAKDCREVTLRVTQVGRTSNNGVEQHHYSLRDDTTEKVVTHTFKKDERPFFVSTGSSHVLALRANKGETLLVLRHDLYPLAMDMHAIAEAKTRAVAYELSESRSDHGPETEPVRGKR